MFYTSNKFWVETGADIITTILDYLEVKVSKDEMEDFISQREYLNEDVNDNYEPIYINLAKAWEIVRVLVLKIKEHKTDKTKISEGWLYDEIILLYKTLDPTNRYLSMFEGKTSESKKFIGLLDSFIERISLTETVEPLLEFLGVAFIELLITKDLGELTGIYFWFMLECVLISRGYGPIIITEKSELRYIFGLQEKITIEIKKYLLKDFSNLKQFREVVNFWTNKIELFRMEKINLY
ncbi:hypothetical protein [Spiroplasma taiwanense]|uniref:Uncharacterized protein n=1 Tax=Spiroplasma taiwanense CT-1 TaxID=1276220 RepID=S5LXU2_9MOLU|nr:hypothetical protein [Spiroplasma taiwanense]AGR41416.1 hypothetical protein STAIW_v1c08280 [Spiroplasma taiwanense CT-1]